MFRHRFWVYVIFVALFAFSLGKSESAEAASGTVYESEPNNTYLQADSTQDDYNSFGAISSASDVDWWKVTFTKCGNAQFSLVNIPSGCNYNLYLYNCDGTSLLASSANSGNTSETFNAPVLLGVTYYIKIVSAVGCSNSYYLFKVTNSPEVVWDGVYSVYGNTSAYASFASDKMNCYGYAMHVYCTDPGYSCYKQQPGEFIHDSQSIGDLSTQIHNMISNTSVPISSALYFLVSKISGDLQAMGGSNWTVTTTSAWAAVPAGKRIIALVINRDGSNSDYHFYVRHSDGTWSHKPGAGSIRNTSFITNVVITDDNIEDVVTENGYDDGILYLLINKPFVLDYPHQNGHASGTLYTPTSFKDRAGDEIYEYEQNGAAMYRTCHFDYAGDVDYYEIVPNTTKNCTIRTYFTTSDYNIDIVLYDHLGNIIASDLGLGNAVIHYTLSAGTKYYIKIYDVNYNITDYVLVITG